MHAWRVHLGQLPHGRRESELEQRHKEAEERAVRLQRESLMRRGLGAMRGGAAECETRKLQ